MSCCGARLPRDEGGLATIISALSPSLHRLTLLRPSRVLMARTIPANPPSTSLRSLANSAKPVSPCFTTRSRTAKSVAFSPAGSGLQHRLESTEGIHSRSQCLPPPPFQALQSEPTPRRPLSPQLTVFSPRATAIHPLRAFCEGYVLGSLTLFTLHLSPV